MRLCLLFGTICAFCALAVSFPQPRSITKVVIETETILDRQLTSNIAGLAITITPDTATTTMDYMAVIISMLAIFTPPSNLSEYTDLPSSLSWGLEAVAISGVGGVPAYMSAINAGISMGLGEMPISEYIWFSSQRDGAYSFLPEILSLGGGVISLDMTSASEMVSALSALSASEAYLSSHVFTSVTISLSMTVNTAVITSQVLVPGSTKNGLSTGEKIGLGIGIPAFTIGLLLVGFIVFHVRRNRYLENETAVFLSQNPVRTHSTRSNDNSSSLAPRFEPDRGLPNFQEMTENAQEQAGFGPRALLPTVPGQIHQPSQRPHSLAAIESVAYQQSNPSSRRPLSTGRIPSSSGFDVEQLSRHYSQTGANVGLVHHEPAEAQEVATELPATPVPGQQHYERESLNDLRSLNGSDALEGTPTSDSFEPSESYPASLRARLDDREKPAMRAGTTYVYDSDIPATNSSIYGSSSSLYGDADSGVGGEVGDAVPAEEIGVAP